MYVNMMDV